MDAANPGAMFIERARVNPESSSGPPTAEQTVEARPAGYYPPTTVAPANRRGHVERDLAPIRSNNGLSFADMLARNGGTRPDADARHHPPSPTRVVQFFNFQRSPACAKSFSSKEFPTALTGPAPFNTHTEDPGADPELLGAKRKAPSTIAGPESLLESPPYTSAVRRRDSESVQMCTPSTADSSPMATHHHAYSGTEVNTVGTNIDGQNTAVQGAFSPLQEGPPSILPYDIDPEHGLPHVTRRIAVCHAAKNRRGRHAGSRHRLQVPARVRWRARARRGEHTRPGGVAAVPLRVARRGCGPRAVPLEPVPRRRFTNWFITVKTR